MGKKIKQGMDVLKSKNTVTLSVLFVLFLLVGLFVFFSSYSSYGQQKFDREMIQRAPAFYADTTSGSGSFSKSEVAKISDSANSQSSSLEQDRKIVKNASLDILVKKIEDTAEKIRMLVSQHDGVVDSSNVSSQGIDTKYGTMVIRVPNEQFDIVVREIGSLAVKVNSEQVTSEDVTLRYVDLEARLKSKKAVEEQYVVLLQKANKVEEIVAVHAYLDRVREDIEVTQAQLNYLSNQVSMSSISISMTSEAEVKILGITWHPITTIKQSFRNALKDVADVIDWCIRFVFALPGIILQILVVVGVVWVLIKGVKKVSVLVKKDTL